MNSATSNPKRSRRRKKWAYILQVDLEYPQELHASHNSFPLAPESINITEQDLSPYSLRCMKTLTGKRKHKSTKLTATFNVRRNYVVHCMNLRLYMELGMKLLKIHRGIKFHQRPFVAPYIQHCTEGRRQAKTKVEGDNLKLLSNSLYGKVRKSLPHTP